MTQEELERITSEEEIAKIEENTKRRSRIRRIFISAGLVAMFSAMIYQEMEHQKRMEIVEQEIANDYETRQNMEEEEIKRLTEQSNDVINQANDLINEYEQRIQAEGKTGESYAPAGSVLGADGRVYTTIQVPTNEYVDPVTGETINYAPNGAVMNGDNAYVTTVTDPMQYSGDVISSRADSYVNPHNGDTVYDIPDDAIGVQTQIGEDGEKSVVYYQHR